MAHKPSETYGDHYCGDCTLNVAYWQFVTCEEFLRSGRDGRLIDERILASQKSSRSMEQAKSWWHRIVQRMKGRGRDGKG